MRSANGGCASVAAGCSSRTDPPPLRAAVVAGRPPAAACEEEGEREAIFVIKPLALLFARFVHGGLGGSSVFNNNNEALSYIISILPFRCLVGCGRPPRSSCSSSPTPIFVPLRLVVAVLGYSYWSTEIDPSSSIFFIPSPPPPSLLTSFSIFFFGCFSSLSALFSLLLLVVVVVVGRPPFLSSLPIILYPRIPLLPLFVAVRPRRQAAEERDDDLERPERLPALILLIIHSLMTPDDGHHQQQRRGAAIIDVKKMQH